MSTFVLSHTQPLVIYNTTNMKEVWHALGVEVGLDNNSVRTLAPPSFPSVAVEKESIWLASSKWRRGLKQLSKQRLGGRGFSFSQQSDCLNISDKYLTKLAKSFWHSLLMTVWQQIMYSDSKTGKFLDCSHVCIHFATLSSLICEVKLQAADGNEVNPIFTNN